ncbi:uncharacterized protein LOC143188538 [Calliopsis andreniformis]|uniref:uncharacterized protein LOC143188538 n=1 Tax=Calliopsis andreniformis TaxID=337506 RepID=UPI003FCE972E
MYGRQGNSNNPQQPPWLVRAEVTIRHGTPVTSESGQTPVNVSSTVTDSSGVRMVYRWNTTQSTPTLTVPVPAPPTQSVPSSSSTSFGFQRGNILFTSTSPPRPSSGFYTIPRSGSSGIDESLSSRGRGVNVSDSGYTSEQFSPQSYSSLPSRRPTQQYNRRCKSTCSIVLSAVNTSDGSKNETTSKIATSESVRHSYDNSWRHHSSHQHVFSRHQFHTLPDVSEEGAEGNAASSVTTHFCSKDKVTNKSTTVSKDASSQTTDIESRESSMIVSKNKVRRKMVTGLQRLDEQKKIKQESQSPSTATETTSFGPSAESEKSDSSTQDDSTKRKSRTVHIDVYCTGSDDDENSDSSTDNERDTPLTVFENPDVKVIHTQVAGNILPRGFQDDKAFLKRATERRCDSFRHAPMRMPSLASSKGYDSDDVLSSLYPSQYSSYSALRDIDSTPWSAASSNTGFPFDYDSTIATSSKDTFSDIESLINSKTDLTPCDSFEYASSSDRERIRRMEEVWDRSEKERSKQWRSPQIERKYWLQKRKMRESIEKHEAGWSSADSGEDSDESGTVGWSFVSSEESQRIVRKSSTVRRASKSTTEYTEKDTSNVKENEPSRNSRTDRSDFGARSDQIYQPTALREQIGSFGSKSPSPLPSKVPSRVTSPFMTPQGERTDHILKASIFGAVVNAFRKPGHHIGPSKNPSCSCEHCRRYFEELNSRERSSSISEFERLTGIRFQRKIVRPVAKNCK